MAVNQNATYPQTYRNPTGFQRWWNRNQLKVIPYFYIAPFFILFSIFLLYPIANSFYISFHKQYITGDPTFVGLKNYIGLFSDPRFKNSLFNTTVYALGSLIIQVPIAFLIAYVVNSKLVPSPGAKSLYRMAYFTPLLTSTIVASLMFGILYDYNSGLINNYLMAWFGEGAKVGWLRDTTIVKFSIIIVLVWRFVGLISLYFLAGLQNIPKELEEAAAIDGANWWIILTRIILPLLRPVLLFVTVQAINGSYQIFAEPYMLTGGGPSDKSLSIVQYFYQTGFSSGNLGYAAAIAYTLVLIIVTLAVLNLRVFGAFSEDK